MTQPPTSPPRTAAATRARMRAREQRMAAELVARGWTCTPPAEPTTPTHGATPVRGAGPTRSPAGVAVDLVAVIRPAAAGAVGARDSRVTVCGPPATGSKPRANLDGAGPHERAAFIAAGHQVPARADSEAQTRPFADLLAAQGYAIDGVWVCGRDVDGRRYARVCVREVNR